MLVLTAASLVFFFWFERHWLLQTALVLALIGIFLPAVSGWVHRTWMLLAKGLGWFNGRVLLSIVFFIVITPIAILTRKARTKSLFLKKKTTSDGGYFIDRRHHYEAKDLENTF